MFFNPKKENVLILLCVVKNISCEGAVDIPFFRVHRAGGQLGESVLILTLKNKTVYQLCIFSTM